MTELFCIKIHDMIYAYENIDIATKADLEKAVINAIKLFDVNITSTARSISTIEDDEDFIINFCVDFIHNEEQHTLYLDLFYPKPYNIKNIADCEICLYKNKNNVLNSISNLEHCADRFNKYLIK
jgi:hypothetical protein